MGDWISDKLGSFMGMILMIGIPVGSIYWFWLAWQMHSLGMYFLTVVIPVSGPLGLWCLIFGVPDWVNRLFG